MKVNELVNISNVVVPVQYMDGTMTYLPPRGKLVNVEVLNLNSIRRFLHVKENLNEVGRLEVPAETLRPAVQSPTRKRRKAPINE